MNKTPRVWKVSHGKSGAMSDLDHAWLTQRQYVAQGWAPDDKKGQGQGQSFAEIRQGDYFYLVRNGKVILLGKFSTNAPEPPLPSVKAWPSGGYGSTTSSRVLLINHCYPLPSPAARHGNRRDTRQSGRFRQRTTPSLRLLFCSRRSP